MEEAEGARCPADQVLARENGEVGEMEGDGGGWSGCSLGKPNTAIYISGCGQSGKGSPIAQDGCGWNGD